MSKELFDASLGLAFSLTVFERYRKNGLLQAELHHVPGIRGHCQGYIQLVEGKVTACYVEEENGSQHPIAVNTLVRIDAEKGPFAWRLTPLPPPPSLTPNLHMPPQAEQYSPTPRIIAPLDIEKLRGWTSTQKLMLAAVYEAVNGQRNIVEIKKELPLAPDVTEEALRILVALKVIIILS